MGFLREAASTLADFEAVITPILNEPIGRLTNVPSAAGAKESRMNLTVEEKQQKLQESKYIWLRMMSLLERPDKAEVISRKCQEVLRDIICYECIEYTNYHRLEKVAIGLI